MKKFIFFSLIAVMVAGMAFAQDSGITFGAWGRGVFSPLIIQSPGKSGTGEDNKDENGDKIKADVYAGSGVTWGSSMANVGFTIKGDSDYAGFLIQFAGETMKTGDQQMLWVKPFSNDLLKVSIGNIFDDTLRGKLNTDSGFENFVLGPMGEDDIFKRFGDNSAYGDAPHQFMLSSAPIEGLFIGFMVRGDIWSTYAADAYRYMHLGAGYDIAGIGHLRAQYRGGWLGTVDVHEDGFYKQGGKGKYWGKPPSGWGKPPSGALGLADGDDDDDGDNDHGNSFENLLKDLTDHKELMGSVFGPVENRAKIELAFALTAIENLLVDVGFRIGLPLEFKWTADESVKFWDGISVSVGARYNMGAIGILGQVNVIGMGNYVRDTSTGVTDDSFDGAAIALNLIPTYELEAATVGLSLGMRINNIGWKAPDGKKFGELVKDKDDKKLSLITTQIGFGGFVQKQLGNGNIRAGLTYALGPIQDYIDNNDAKKTGILEGGKFSIPIIAEISF